MTESAGPENWPQDKLTALGRGQRLVAEVPASQPGRRAFVEISPPGESAGGFRVEHWEYDAALLDGWDYDRGAVLVRSASVVDHAALTDLVLSWRLLPGQFTYPWKTDDPR